MTRSAYAYDRVAWCYEAIAACGSLGAIPRMKAAQVEAFMPGTRVLYVGAGAGEDALLAASRGAVVTCLDRSAAMLRRLARRLAAAELEAELVEVDLLDFEGGEGFDAVVANFFLNVFDRTTVHAMLARIAMQLGPGGQLFVADFRPPDGGRRQRLGYNAYYQPLNWGAWALGLCALHPIYDYAQMLPAAGFRMMERRAVGWFSWRGRERGPRCYENWIAERI